MQSNIERIARILIDKKLTIAFVESATAGRLTSEFSKPTDAGSYLKGAIVCYDACLKEDLLKVDQKLIEIFTPESPQVTEAITIGLSKLIRADIHIGVTGLPAPGGSETSEKPVGTMFIHALLHGKELFRERRVYIGQPEQIILSTVGHVATLLIEHLED